MNKPFYLGLSILELSKILMYECWHDNMKSKQDVKVLCGYRQFNCINKNR